MQDADLLQMNADPEIVSLRVQIHRFGVVLGAVDMATLTIDNECQALREDYCIAAQIILVGDA